MDQSARNSQLARIVALLGAHPPGLTSEGLAAVLPEGLVSARTLQRWLARLVGEGRIVAKREGRGLRYCAQPAGNALPPASWPPLLPLPPLKVREPSESYVPTSPAGEEIKALVRQPLMARRPVGYEVALLEAYYPNQTWYLPLSLREQLHALGRSSAQQAPAGTFARDILHRLLIDLSWSSSRLEGNTYSLLETERLIELGEAAEGKQAFETQMILNHKAAIEYLVLRAEHAAVDADTIVSLHALLSDGLLADPMACGRVRRRAVEIGGSVYRPLALPQRLEELFGHVLDIGARIEDPFEQAFFLMVHLPYLQPFEDVNKRVSRLAANIPLVRHNLSPLSFLDVPERAYVDGLLGVYELRRVELLRDVFVWAYERSCQQYVAVRSQLVPPDTFRLRHRAALAEAIAALVRAGLAPREESISPVVPASVPPMERPRFVRLVQDEFKSLHAGNAVRFGLRPLEYDAWRKALE